MHEMFNFLQKEHKTMVFIEETHWMIGWQINHGHSPKGEKVFTNRMLACTSFSALAAITSSGHAYTLVVKGSVTGDVFLSIIIHLLQFYESRHSSEQGVFYMDNAPIHKQNELKQLFDANDHILFFAPSYSAEMNPIEFLFSSWKCKADMMLKGR